METYNCIICGTPTPGIILDGDPNKIVCPRCWGNLDTCDTCVHGDCTLRNAILTHTTPFEPMIQRTRQEGPMVISMPEINPRLVDVYCEDCICREERRCVHFTDHYCEKYKME